MNVCKSEKWEIEIQYALDDLTTDSLNYLLELKSIFDTFNLDRRVTISELYIQLRSEGDLGDNCIQNFHLGRYIVGYTVGNLVLWRRISGAVKRDFRMYIRRYTSPNENFEHGYPHSNALLTFSHQKDSKNVLYAPIRPATPAA